MVAVAEDSLGVAGRAADSPEAGHIREQARNHNHAELVVVEGDIDQVVAVDNLLKNR